VQAIRDAAACVYVGKVDVPALRKTIDHLAQFMGRDHLDAFWQVATSTTLSRSEQSGLIPDRLEAVLKALGRDHDDALYRAEKRFGRRYLG
jgi:hypothetical protein